ncbi:MAG TPA: CHAT domain-containing protein, partial [Chitinophagaceae bacterium]|nr:CHAT domain-containing protein [Chitinophagaceae bacterium]
MAGEKDNGFIEFYSTGNEPDSRHRLYEQEIYPMDLQSARLVILSACETGKGPLVNGEGIINLSRAFSYAGCKSVITSLWKADDISTAFIMQRLHHYLMAGRAKDEALQQARIDYLENGSIDMRYKTPASWSHLILIGDYAPVKQTGFIWEWTVGFAAIAVAMLLLKRKRKREQITAPATVS